MTDDIVINFNNENTRIMLKGPPCPISYPDKLKPTGLIDTLFLPVVKTKKMSISHTIALGVPEAPDGLVEPDGDVHRQDFV